MLKRLGAGRILWADGHSLFDNRALSDAYKLGIDRSNHVFEGLRAYEGSLFKPEAHIARLLASARSLRLACLYSAQDIQGACEEVVAMPGMRNAYLLPVVWKGTSPVVSNCVDLSVRLAITAWSWPQSFMAEPSPSAARLSLASWHTLMPRSVRGDVKCSDLLDHYAIPRLEARASGFDDALLLDHRGLVTQTTRANIFFVCAGTLHTPKAENFIDGITRQTLIDIARREGIEVYERHILPGTLGYASEVFLTGTAIEVAPVEAIGDYKFPTVKMTALLRDSYKRLVQAGAPAQLQHTSKNRPLRQKAWL
ncbi:aminotransferase class IV [Henriciella sp.]|uniref:aminotransferase class IV n=1 Tax=Henriciella sp. TaxID=1968823 RepID=UPI0026149C6B|nr:aminotransferase class IV [Henriciella sp.]